MSTKVNTLKDFAIGDTVALISGGPPMTVVKICEGKASPQAGIVSTEDEIHAWWFDKNLGGAAALCKATFTPGALSISSDVKPAEQPEQPTS